MKKLFILLFVMLLATNAHCAALYWINASQYVIANSVQEAINATDLTLKTIEKVATEKDGTLEIIPGKKKLYKVTIVMGWITLVQAYIVAGTPGEAFNRLCHQVHNCNRGEVEYLGRIVK